MATKFFLYKFVIGFQGLLLHINPEFMRTLFLALCSIIFFSCTEQEKRLPILGNFDVNVSESNGENDYDTIYHSIMDFEFVNQDSLMVSNKTFENKIYVSDFFFTSCPSICPIMKGQMLRLYEEFESNQEVAFLSHTIDPEYDTVALLKDYAERLGVSSEKWHFVTGDKQEIFKIAQLSYMSVAANDANAPGGYIHSGRFLLVDKKRHIRGAYDGTSPEDVDQLIFDMYVLLKEYETE